MVNFQIFAINTVIPMLGTVYWEGEMPVKYQAALNCATLVGSMLGQVLFGVLADRFGRRRIYGLELVVTITASLGMASASTGVNRSMSLIAWLLFWRCLMGVGIGADYPLSAVITSEYVPAERTSSVSHSAY
jgi:MFS transporter, PHS family, inorganic phosphate transporter